MIDMPPKLRAKFRRWEQKQRNWNREKDPMYLQVKAALVEMFGKDTASAVDLMTKASTQQLTSENAEHRWASPRVMQRNSNFQKRVSLGLVESSTPNTVEEASKPNSKSWHSPSLLFQPIGLELLPSMRRI